MEGKHIIYSFVPLCLPNKKAPPFLERGRGENH